jgi:hypothetical protein
MNRTALVLVSFAVIFGTLCVVSYTQKSATWDEPQHLTAGCLALRQHDYRLDPEHPPFLRLWAALPLTCAARADTAMIDRSSPDEWAGLGQFYFAHKFLYVDNDADRLLYRARFMIVVLGVLLGVLLFAWVREWLGFWPATSALGFFCLEPNLQAHAALVTTDFGIACFMFGALYFLWRTTRRWSAGNVAGLTVFFALAIVSKYSAVLLGPIVLLLLILARVKPLRIAGLVLLLAAAAWLAVWATYGFRYAPSANASWLYRFDQDAETIRRVPVTARVVSWADAHRLLPNVFLQGFLHGQSKAQLRSAFLAGKISTSGWWYYFPAAFLIKTPASLILLLVAGLMICAWRWRSFRETGMFIVLPAVLYFVTAMTQRLNIGVRHLLPVIPLALMLAALAASRWRVVTGVLAVFWVFEFARVYPDNLAFFNQAVGGPRHGYKFLVDSNLDWGQDLKPLKRWMDGHAVKQVALSYFGTADPAYYGIQCTHLPGTAFYLENATSAPQLPGYVAVSATCLQGVYLSEAGKAFYRPLLTREPNARIGNSIFVYWVERPWWQPAPL